MPLCCGPELPVSEFQLALERWPQQGRAPVHSTNHSNTWGWGDRGQWTDNDNHYELDRATTLLQ